LLLVANEREYFIFFFNGEGGNNSFQVEMRGLMKISASINRTILSMNENYITAHPFHAAETIDQNPLVGCLLVPELFREHRRQVLVKRQVRDTGQLESL
jgi:hypothetical protein